MSNIKYMRTHTNQHQHLGTMIRNWFTAEIGVGDLFLLHLPNTSMAMSAFGIIASVKSKLIACVHVTQIYLKSPGSLLGI